MALTFDELDRMSAEDPEDRAIREAHGFSEDDDWTDKSVRCAACGETYYEIAVCKIERCTGRPS